MKKITLLAAAAMVASAASAQYNCNPETSMVLEKGKVSTVWPMFLDASSIDSFSKQGATVISCQPNEETINWYVWDGTFIGGDSSYPGVGMHFDGYTSLNVSNVGWSGAGLNIAASAAVSTEAWNDDTRLHIGYMSNGNAPASVAFVIANGDEKPAGKNIGPANIAVGAAFNDNGNIMPAVGAASGSDWQGIDLSFSDLKKLCPSFNYLPSKVWAGNLLAVLAGGVQGQNISLDACYLYNLGNGSGVEGVEAENLAWQVSSEVINLLGGNGIELYDMSGKLVKATEGAALGTNGPAAGVYVARSGNSSCKVIVK